MGNLRRAFLVVSVCSVAGLLLLLLLSGGEDDPPEGARTPLRRLTGPGFVLDTTGCQIPDWDPFDPSLLPFLSQPPLPYHCPGRPPLLLSHPGARLTLDESLLGLYYGASRDNLTCSYRAIKRESDAAYRMSSQKPLIFDQPLKDEFVVAQCNVPRAPTFTQYIPLVPLKPRVEEKKKAGKPDPLNIIIVGIDSVSKLNFLRHFHKTRRFIKENLSAFELNGYTKVADNTFPNLVPFLTGHFIENYWNESIRDMFFDNVDFIWKNYSSRGYRTLFAEDAPHIATFNYLKKGFKNPPADYYFRPFALALEKSAVHRDSKANCVQSRFEIDLLFSYTSDFVKTMGLRPYFAFTFVARLTHDSLNAAAFADEPTARLLSDLHASGATNSSLLVLFSDHGIRFGPIRQTYIGKFEERMPFIFLSFPSWFLERHPQLAANLRANQDRLTTPFDVHATLLHLLDLRANGSSAPHGISLLQPVPETRTCEQASILPHWCPCQTHRAVPLAEPVVVQAALALLDHVNELLQPMRNACAQLRLDKVLDARFGEPNDLVLRFVKHQNDVIGRRVVLGEAVRGPGDYLVVVRARPSGAVLEGTVRHDAARRTFRILDDVSRLNRYGGQAECIDNAHLRKFCFCNGTSV